MWEVCAKTGWSRLSQRPSTPAPAKRTWLYQHQQQAAKRYMPYRESTRWRTEKSKRRDPGVRVLGSAVLCCVSLTGLVRARPGSTTPVNSLATLTHSTERKHRTASFPRPAWRAPEGGEGLDRDPLPLPISEGGARVWQRLAGWLTCC